MAKERLSMRKIVEILRLKHECGLKHRRIARSVGVARSTVCDYLYRAAAAGLAWPLPESMTEVEVERLLFPPAPAIAPGLRPQPDWVTVHQELRRKGMTLLLLWQEYKTAHPDGLRYSWFCQSYRLWSGKLNLVMRQEHRAGEKLFVDYAGQTVPVTERATGEIRQAQIFVAVLGASNYTYAEATWTQTLPDWIGAHVRAFEFLGGVPEVVVPDNLKSGVTRACRYDPDLNPTYREFARHYQVAIIPARVARPRDKAKVEAGVLLVERWILARLRHRQFFSLTELNAAIAELLTDLNHRAFKKLPGSRASQFAAIDQPVLRELPVVAYQYAEWSHPPGVRRNERMPAAPPNRTGERTCSPITDQAWSLSFSPKSASRRKARPLQEPRPPTGCSSRFCFFSTRTCPLCSRQARSRAPPRW